MCRRFFLISSKKIPYSKTNGHICQTIKNNLITMGRGDKRTAKGKRFKGSFGISRPHVAKKKATTAKSATAPAKKTAAKKVAAKKKAKE
jgi:30S ribosomal protein S31